MYVCMYACMYVCESIDLPGMYTLFSIHTYIQFVCRNFLSTVSMWVYVTLCMYVCMNVCMCAGAVEEEEEDEGDQIQEQVDHEGGGGHGSPADMEEICHQGT